MPYKDAEQARQASKERMAKYRAKAVTPDVTPSQNVTPCVTPEERKKLTENPFITPASIAAVLDPEKRNRLERINECLQAKGLGQGVTYGWGGPDFNIIDKMLKVTEA